MNYLEALARRQQYAYLIGKDIIHKKIGTKLRVDKITIVPDENVDYSSFNWINHLDMKYVSFLAGRNCILHFIFDYNPWSSFKGTFTYESNLENYYISGSNAEESAIKPIP